MTLYKFFTLGRTIYIYLNQVLVMPVYSDFQALVKKDDWFTTGAGCFFVETCGYRR